MGFYIGSKREPTGKYDGIRFGFMPIVVFWVVFVVFWQFLKVFKQGSVFWFCCFLAFFSSAEVGGLVGFGKRVSDYV